MNKELARDLLKVFSTPEMVRVIHVYADAEIDKANKGLQTLVDEKEIFRLQGVVRSMIVLKTIRDQAVATLEKV